MQRILEKPQRILEHPMTERVITALILINAITLGLETYPSIMARFGPFLTALDAVILSVFVAEILAKLAIRRGDFFRDPWNIFDFAVVAIALIPASGPLSVLRALRILRILRLITVVPALKRVVGALLGALPGMGSIILLLGLIFYVGAVMTTQMFGNRFPEWFGSIPASAYTLFQVMTLESWSMGIVRPVMEVYPYAWAFFVPFILCTTFTALNLFIGVVVSAMQDEVNAQQESEMEAAIERAEAPMLAELQALRQEVARLANRLEPR